MTSRISAIAVLLLLLVACAEQEPGTQAETGPTPVAAATVALLTPTPTPVAPPTAVPTAAPPTRTPSATPVPSPTFDPGPVILPTVEIPTKTPPAELEEPLERTLDGIALRVNVLRELSSIRGVDRSFITRDDLSIRLKGLFEEERDEILKTQQLYATLGILSKDTDLYELLLGLYSEGVLGYFDTEDEKLFVVKRAGDFGPAETVVYVHEFVHALQQQNFDIHGTGEGLEANSDASSAYRALIEGDARLAELLYMSQHLTEEEQAASEPEASEALIQAFRSAPHVILRAYSFPYLEGTRFALSLYQTAGWNSVNLAFDEVPRSTEQILHPERYIDREEPKVVTLPDLANSLGEGWSEVTRDTMGEFFLMAYLESGFAFREAAVAADGWGGDTYSLLKGPQDESLLVLPIAWDSERDAREFRDTFVDYTEARTGLQWESADDGTDSRLMKLDDQVIFVSREALDTLLVFAPDLSVLEAVRVALGSDDGAGE